MPTIDPNMVATRIRERLTLRLGEPKAITLRRRGGGSTIDTFTAWPMTGYIGHITESQNERGQATLISEIRIFDEGHVLERVGIDLIPRQYDQVIIEGVTWSIMTIEQFRIPGIWICGIETARQVT